MKNDNVTCTGSAFQMVQACFAAAMLQIVEPEQRPEYHAIFVADFIIDTPGKFSIGRTEQVSGNNPFRFVKIPDVCFSRTFPCVQVFVSMTANGVSFRINLLQQFGVCFGLFAKDKKSSGGFFFSEQFKNPGCDIRMRSIVESKEYLFRFPRK